MRIEFEALIKSFSSRALVSLDKSFEVRLQGEDIQMIKLADAPADKTAKITVEWSD